MAIILNPHPIAWENLPGWVKAYALNYPDRYTGATWTATGNGGYVARRPDGALIDTVRQRTLGD